MMKKISFILVICLLAMCLFACNPPSAEGESSGESGTRLEESTLGEANTNSVEGTDEVESENVGTSTQPSDGSEDGGNEDPTPTVDIYKLLNGLSQKTYDEIRLEIDTVIGDVTLSSEYKICGSSVRYSVEKMNAFTEDATDFSDSYKSEIEGSAVIENGKIIKLNDDSVELPEYEKLSGQFCFSKSNFRKIDAEDGTFKANIVDLSVFLKGDVQATDARISVIYTENALIEIALSYKTSSAEIEILYSFR